MVHFYGINVGICNIPYMGGVWGPGVSFHYPVTSNTNRTSLSHFSLQLVEAAESHPRWWNSVMEVPKKSGVYCWKRWALRFSIPGGKIDRTPNSLHLKMGSTLETKIPDMEIIYFWMAYC